MNTVSAGLGIHTVDTGFLRPRFDASFLIIEHGRAAFVDCGTNQSQPRLLAALQSRGLTPEAVDYLVLTHVHLDHAGGAGALMAVLPEARLVVHPRGAPHMIDPARLVAGATAVYGEQEVARSYGELLPVPAGRVIEAADGFDFSLAGRPLRCLDAPGHARHHLVLWDQRSRGFFTGDCFGLSYRELDSERGPFMLPTTTPVQFEPEALKATIARMMAHAPKILFLTHFGPISAHPDLAQSLCVQIDRMVELALAAANAGKPKPWLREALTDLYLGRAREHGCRIDRSQLRELLAVDIELNAQGLEVWRARRKKSSGRA